MLALSAGGANDLEIELDREGRGRASRRRGDRSDDDGSAAKKREGIIILAGVGVLLLFGGVCVSVYCYLKRRASSKSEPV